MLWAIRMRNQSFCSRNLKVFFYGDMILIGKAVFKVQRANRTYD